MAGIVITIVFAVAVLGAHRAQDARRADNRVAAGAYGLLRGARHGRDTRRSSSSRSPSSRRSSPSPFRTPSRQSRTTRAGAPTAIENGGRSRVTTLLAAITQRSPIVTPLVTTTLTPHQTLSPIRVGPLVVKPCHVTGRVEVVEAVAAVGYEAAVGEHAVVADLDELDAGDHDPEVEEAALADRHACVAGHRDPHPGSSSVPSPIARRPSRSASSALPWIGQRAYAPRRPAPSAAVRGSTGAPGARTSATSATTGWPDRDSSCDVRARGVLQEVRTCPNT